MASTRPAPPADRNGRFALLGLTLGGIAMFVWLVANLAASAFG